MNMQHINLPFGKRTCPPLTQPLRRRTSLLSKRTLGLFAGFGWAALLLSLLAMPAYRSFPLSTTHAQEAAASATPEAHLDPVAIHQALLDLTNPWTVMCIAAHPDDEDGTSLIVLKNKHGVHTVSVFSTYGEGGQNAVGPELYEELGVIRARETMAAAEIQGSEPHFLGLKDFGFSKSADEAFRIWGHEEALRRMVLKIRQLRPDVIITNHDTTSGHGHHQATGRLLLEAFDIAADPQRFSEQLRDGVQPWQVKRIFVRARAAARSSAASDSAPEILVAIDPNERDAVRNTTFAEQALQALQKHETQGPWPKTVAAMARARNSTDGRLPLIRYRLVRASQNAQPLPQTPATFLDGLSLSEAETARLAAPKIEDKPLFEFEAQPDLVLEALVRARKSKLFASVDVAVDSARFHLMRDRLDRALTVLSGATLTLNASNSVLVPGNSTDFSLNFANGGSHTLSIPELRLNVFGSGRPIEAADQLPPGTETTKTIQILTPNNAAISVPPARHLYDGRLFGERFIAEAVVELDGARFRVQTSKQLDVSPAIAFTNISPSPYVWTPATGSRPLAFNVQVVNHLPKAFSGTLSMSGAQGRIIGTGQKLTLAEHESREVVLKSSALPLNLLKTRAAKRQRSLTESSSITLSVRSAGTDEEITSDVVQIVRADARVVTGVRVAFVPSFDQTIESSLKALGVEATRLSPPEVQTADLKMYDTIIIDNRGYEAHPELIAANDRLLSFAREGGTLIVFYHKDNEWNPDPAKNRPQLAPYPIILSDQRVTDENAPVTFLKRNHPLLNFPNRIGPADFINWIQERGLYYPREWDAHYTALLSMNDAGEPPLQGGLLVAPYERGQYIYTSLVWYRQLRGGLPGAYRMLANMISYGHTRKP
jgi:LmbE family N-acetylglucosaminyl deacetylase